MPISMKKRYPRAVRFRRIASNNNQIQQTRRFELVPTVSNLLQVVTCLFDRPVIIRSDAVAVTGIRDQASLPPTAITYTPGSTQSVDITFGGAAPTTITFPFEDLAIRDQIGAYVRAGDYVGGG